MGNDRRQRCLSYPWRSPKDKAADTAGFNHLAYNGSWANQMLLTNVFIQGSWTHSFRQRCTHFSSETVNFCKSTKKLSLVITNKKLFITFAYMKLSILIPTYNQDCSKLVKDLATQCQQSALEYEILVMDDGSSDQEAVQANRRLVDMPHCSLFEFLHNQGRSFVRNRLMQRSMGDYLLFVDSDAVVTCPDYIANYLQYLPTKAVIYGGILHPDSLPSYRQSLRYMYEKHCEPMFKAENRNRHPYQNLRTFNVLLPREVALSHPFNENIRHYGYEDTLLGKNLERDGIQVLHIDNPLVNGDIETNSRFLQKTEESLRTLKQFEEELRGSSALIEYYDKLKEKHLTGLMSFVYRLLHIPMRLWLLSPWPSFKVLQFYKLGYYCSL